jgi:hypothetical protein
MALFLPLLTLILSFVLQKWSWGLMDDLNILSLGSSAATRAGLWFQGLSSYGQFKPLTALHAGIFYTVFENNPVGFYVFRVFEISAMLLLWGLFAYRLTGNILSIALVGAITLSFHYFYDAFFYLSSAETIGLLFLGIAMNLFLFNHERVTLQWGLGLLFLLAAFASKETFISSGMALGISYLYLAWGNRQKNEHPKLIFTALFLIVISLIYGACLLIFVKSGYSMRYSWNMAKFSENLNVWVKKDFYNHLPWLFAAIVIAAAKALYGRKRGRMGIKQKWGLFLGFLLYVNFLSILIPWNTSSYYAVPLGLFFGLLMTLFLSDSLSGLNFKPQFLIVIFALIFNQLVCLYVLNRESTYQYDTKNVARWLIGFSGSAESGWNNCVQTNAIEPAETLPQLINRQSGLKINKFHWLRDTNQLAYNIGCDLYLYSPRFSGIDLTMLKDWEIVFLSKNWTMYKRRKG